MRIEYDLTPEDCAAFGEYCVLNSPAVRRMTQVAVVGGIALSLITFGAFWLRSGSAWWLAAGFAVAVAWGWYWPRQVVANARAGMSNRERPCLRGRHVMEALPAGLVAKCDVTEATIRWVGIHSIARTTNHVFVMRSDIEGFVIPIGRVTSGDIDQFVKEVDRCLGSVA